MRTSVWLLAWQVLCFSIGQAADPPPGLLSEMRHLRIAGPPEWSDFAEMPDADHLEIRFNASRNPTDFALQLRQQDVRRNWQVRLNDSRIGDLVEDENDQTILLPVSAGILRDGENLLTIAQNQQDSKTPDDIRVGDVRLIPGSRDDYLQSAHCTVDVIDSGTNRTTPCRIVITNEAGSLQTIGAVSSRELAVRPGVIYSGTGHAEFGLPPGKFTVTALRGFEYSKSSIPVVAKPGEHVTHKLEIRREVSTPGYVACDTHIHTLTHSGHGDASIRERMLTIAGEGIELPVATDHNVQIDYEPLARELKVREFFTPVIGNEVTTVKGHFNIFPVASDAPAPSHDFREAAPFFDELFRTPGVQVITLNHGRDVHNGFRPLGPERFNAAIGRIDDPAFVRFNAMEIINSGSTQNDSLELCRDWMAMLNGGHEVTPVGGSDSHDVNRYIVGQGRTYIRCDDSDPANIDVQAATQSLRDGHVLVSYGLLTELTVNGAHSGDLAGAPGDSVPCKIHVSGPSWVQASNIQLYSNGVLIREETIAPTEDRKFPGLIWSATWTIPRSKHDVHLVAIATGPGLDGPEWHTAKPYQPTSPDFESRLLGCSGAIKLDADHDGRWTSAAGYVQKLLPNESEKSLATLVQELGDFDRAVAAQCASRWQASRTDLNSPENREVWQAASQSVRDGFEAFLNAERDREIARREQK